MAKNDLEQKRKSTPLDGHEASQLYMLEEELHQLKEQYGIEEEKSWFRRTMDKIMELKYAPHPVNRKKYIKIAIFTGWFGGHRLWAKQYFTGVLYLLLFWTGIPAAMTMIDLMIALPKEPDENGIIIM